MAGHQHVVITVPRWFTHWAIEYSLRELRAKRQPDQAFLRFMAFVAIHEEPRKA